MSAIKNRYDFVYLFDVTNGNPNGDPDAGNLPRVDPETGYGLVTDVCLKRKVRNFISLVQAGKTGYDIYVKEKAILNLQHTMAYTALKIDPKNRKTKGKDRADEDRKLTEWMCENFFDIRTFGAVMTTEVNCGQVRGPVQFAMARSVDPIFSQEHAVTRCAVTTEKESEQQSGGNRTMGRKFTIPYALYMAHGFINPHLAAQTGFSDQDLDLLFKSLEQMFETDRSASRGEMNARRLFVFKHESALGNAPAHKLFERIKIARKDSTKPARAFADYEISVAGAKDLPEGIELIEKI